MTQFYVPTHVNQFHDENGKPWGGSFNDRHGDCWAAIGCEALDAGTRGKVTMTPPQFRKAAGVKSLGGNVGDIAKVLTSKGVTVRVPIGGTTWAEVKHRTQSGRWYACIATDYDQVPDDKSCQPSFDGLHMMGALGVPADANGLISGSDPLCDTFKRYDPAVLRSAAGKCADQVGSSGLIVAFVKVPREDVAPPPDPCEAKLAELEQRIADLVDELDDAQSRLVQIASIAGAQP